MCIITGFKHLWVFNKMSTLTQEQLSKHDASYGSKPHLSEEGVLDDTWSNYRLEWLFDEDRIDHLPLEVQVCNCSVFKKDICLLHRD